MNKIKTNIKMRVTMEQSIKAQKICVSNMMNPSRDRRVHDEYHQFLLIDGFPDGTIIHKIESSQCSFEKHCGEEVDAALFIRTNGTCEEPKGHPHAEPMAEYAKDAAETEKPWERWETGTPGHDKLFKLDWHPEWHEDRIYRRKPQRRTVTMPDGTVLPEPVREALQMGDWYFVPNIKDFDCTTRSRWDNDEEDITRLKNGLIHRTEEDAKAWAGYLLSLTQRI